MGGVLEYQYESVFQMLFSLPGQSPGRAIVLPSVSVLAAVALAKCLTLKFFM